MKFLYKVSIFFSFIFASLSIFSDVSSTEEIRAVAKEVTVRINNINDSDDGGSGVIVGCQANVCNVLTASHVIIEGNEYEVELGDGEKYYISNSNVSRHSANKDLAEFKFTTNRQFPEIDYASIEDIKKVPSVVYVSGYPLPSNLFSTREYTFRRTMLRGFSENQSKGYFLVLEDLLKKGMSGGAIFNEQRDLIGIIGATDKHQSGSPLNAVGVPVYLYNNYVAKPKTLEQLLADGRWEEANRKTWLLLHDSINSDPPKKFTKSNVRNLSCSQLREINNLWHEYSNGKFGFRTQMDRYSSFVKINQEVFRAYDYNSFGEAVSWRKNGKWLTYDELTFSEAAPRGSLPVWFTYSNNTDEIDGYGLPSDAYCLASNSPCSAVAASFVQRIRDCDISLH
ncbi:MAG: GUN4 domain-containing protein [Cyanobacteria bacterium J06621_8]